MLYNLFFIKFLKLHRSKLNLFNHFQNIFKYLFFPKKKKKRRQESYKDRSDRIVVTLKVAVQFSRMNVGTTFCN